VQIGTGSGTYLHTLVPRLATVSAHPRQPWWEEHLAGQFDGHGGPLPRLRFDDHGAPETLRQPTDDG